MRSLLTVAVLACSLMCVVPTLGEHQVTNTQSPSSRGLLRDSNYVFTEVPDQPLATPFVERISLPDFPGSNAIWGGTGRDDRGHIWFGVCVHGSPQPSAHLYEYLAESDELYDRGDVVSALRRAGIYRRGESQAKIHSKIIQGADGYLYFATMDEAGADFEWGTRPPLWGGHLWRLRPPDGEWQHLVATKHGLIAVTGGRRYVYALGFFDHVLYQFDTHSAQTDSVRVSSTDGHISRNIVSDFRDHVYVPRLTGHSASLVEYDVNLRKVAENPLQHYLSGSPTKSHGLTGFQPMADGSIVIVTGMGFLYRIRPPFGEGAAAVLPMGWLHPDGPRYASGLFTYGGRRYLMGLSVNMESEYHKEYHWVFYDIDTGYSQPVPFVPRGTNAPNISSSLLYGSATRDEQGRFYVVGRHGGQAILLRVTCP